MRILLIADLHVGSIKDTKYFYDTTINIIDKEINFNKTDMIVFLGDYFDKLFKTNEEFTALAINIMSYIVIACNRNKTKIRIVYGTESHEMNQYRLFNYHLIEKSVDMKIIETVTEEEIDGKKILYIPEEFINDKHKHYKNYLYNNKQYDFIFGHGVIEDGMPSNINFNAANKPNKEKHVPRFKSGEFSCISEFTIFGHYHQYTNICNNVFYLGSLFRDSFGEEIPKGYGILSDNNSNLYNDKNIKDNKDDSNINRLSFTSPNDKYTFSFIENTKAYNLITIEYNPTSDIYTSSNKIIDDIKRIKEEYKELFNGDVEGKIRLKFNVPNDLSPKFRETLKSVLFDEKFISVTINESNQNNVSIIEEDDIEEDINFIVDINLSILDKIYQYAEKKYERKITMEKLKKYLSKSLDQISAKKKIDDEEE